jgi:hypothetical protein
MKNSFTLYKVKNCLTNAIEECGFWGIKILYVNQQPQNGNIQLKDLKLNLK